MMNGEKVQDDWATLERVLPGAFGGTYAYWNVVMFCFKCNNKGSSKISKIIKRGIKDDMKNAGGKMRKIAIAEALREGRIDLSPYNYGQF